MEWDNRKLKLPDFPMQGWEESIKTKPGLGNSLCNNSKLLWQQQP